MKQLQIHTTRLAIRNLDLGDLSDFIIYRSNPEVVKYQGFDVMTLEEAEEFIKDNSKKQFGNLGEWVQYAVTNVETGKLVGDCAIKLDQHDGRLAEIGITISPEEQRKGYAKETLTGILDFLFGQEDFHRVTEIVDADNTASIQLLKSVGFRQEGHFIENIFFKGKWGSEFQFTMLKKEWMEYHKQH